MVTHRVCFVKFLFDKAAQLTLFTNTAGSFEQASARQPAIVPRRLLLVACDGILLSG